MQKVFILLLVFSSFVAKGQGILDLKLKNDVNGKTLIDLLTDIEKGHAAKFYFLPDWIESISITQSDAGSSLKEILDKYLESTNIEYIQMYPNVIVLIKDPSGELLRKNALETAFKRKVTIEQHRIGNAENNTDGQVVLTGLVTDADSGEPIPLAYIQVSDTEFSTTTDANGNYKIKVNAGPHILSISYIDYQSKVLDLSVYKDGVLNIQLEKKSVVLDEVIIQDRSDQELTTSRIGQTHINISKLQRKPAFLGETDLVKNVQNLAGVTTVGEAASGFNVRGGSVDQNLILYDGLPVFNSSHVFGFFSGFNPETIRDVTFYRGGIPAEYGGRASSILDIRSKNGNNEKWKGKASLGIITGNAMVNGPLKKDKTVLAASFRSTYSNWLIHTVHTDYADLSESDVSFYDATIKLRHTYNEKTKLSVSGYSSHDSFSLFGDSTYRWNNILVSAKLDRQLTKNLGAELIGGISSYKYSVLNNDYRTASELSYKINSSVLKSGFNYQKGSHRVNFGLQFMHYVFSPGSLKPESPQSNARNFSLDKQYSIENAIYVADEWSPNEKFTLEAGVRVPVFVSFGPGSVNLYADNSIREISSITDTLVFKSGKAIKTYTGLEPRLSLRWKTSPTSSVKLGYNRIYQFLHLVTNTAAVTPLDIWQPSGYYFKPQRADQVSVGYFKDFHKKKYGLSTELFYKFIDNILDFKDGAQLILNEHLETDLLQGKGTSYGIETSLFKNSGRFTGSLNYTYSRAFRTIKGQTASESINKGKRYPASYDQPHILNFSWKYNLSSRHFFTGNFTYHKGRPVTIPLSVLTLENTTVAYFSERNQYRIPDYHRLDIAFIIEGDHKRDKKWEGTWVFSLYNVYARKNPYTIFFRNTEDDIPKPYQLSVVGTVLPSITYKIEFK